MRVMSGVKRARITMTLTDGELEVIKQSKRYAERLGVAHPVFLSLVMDCYLNKRVLPTSNLVIDMPKDALKASKVTRKYFQLNGAAAETARKFIASAIARRIRPGRLLAILLQTVGDNLSRARLTLSFDGATSIVGEKDVD